MRAYFDLGDRFQGTSLKPWTLFQISDGLAKIYSISFRQFNISLGWIETKHVIKNKGLLRPGWFQSMINRSAV